MKKVILFISIMSVIVLSIMFFSTKDNNLSIEEVNAVVKDYSDEGCVSLKDEYIINYIEEYYDNESIISYEILHDDNSCLVLFFLPIDASKDIIEDCNEIFTKQILHYSDPIGAPIFIPSELRNQLNHKNLKVYIGDRLAIDYKFDQKIFTITDKQYNEDVTHAYEQRKIKDDLTEYITSNLKRKGFRNITIEKSFNNSFLIVKLKGKDVSKAKEFFSSNEFISELEKSQHGFVNEVRVVQTSLDNEIISIYLDRILRWYLNGYQRNIIIL